MTISRFTKSFCLSVLLLAAVQGQSQDQRDTRPRNCAISGRVTINGQAAANAQVTASEIFQTTSSWMAFQQTTTPQV